MASGYEKAACGFDPDKGWNPGPRCPVRHAISEAVCILIAYGLVAYWLWNTGAFVLQGLRWLAGAQYSSTAFTSVAVHIRPSVASRAACQSNVACTPCGPLISMRGRGR